MYNIITLLQKLGFECSIERLPGTTTKIISVENSFGQAVRLWYGYTSSIITRMIPYCVKDEGIDLFLFEQADDNFSIGLIEKLFIGKNGKATVSNFPLSFEEITHILIDLFAE